MLRAVGDAAQPVVREAKDAGAWDYPDTTRLGGGVAIVAVPSREAAMEWTAKFAAACRCPQEVRPFGDDPLA